MPARSQADEQGCMYFTLVAACVWPLVATAQLLQYAVSATLLAMVGIALCTSLVFVQATKIRYVNWRRRSCQRYAQLRCHRLLLWPVRFYKVASIVLFGAVGLLAVFSVGTETYSISLMVLTPMRLLYLAIALLAVALLSVVYAVKAVDD